jgi:hypothetical protein
MALFPDFYELIVLYIAADCGSFNNKKTGNNIVLFKGKPQNLKPSFHTSTPINADFFSSLHIVFNKKKIKRSVACQV